MQETVISSIILAVITLVSVFSFVIAIVRQVTIERDKTQRELYNTILRTQEMERQNIVAEVHDTLGAYITASHLSLEAIKSIYSDNELIQNHINQLENNLQIISQVTRRATNMLIPPTLLRFGIQGILNEYQTQFSPFIQFRILYQVHEPLSQFFQINLYRIINEIVTNSIRHSKAKTIYINLKKDGNKLFLNIGDDGVGFNYAKVKTASCSGLINIENRCKLLNAHFEVNSKVGEGCHYNITFSNYE